MLFRSDAVGSNAQLGVPYRTDPTTSGPEGLDMARNTVEEVYNNVVSDLLEAEILMSNMLSGSSIYDEWYRHKVDKWVIKAMLSRVYFYMGNNSLASSYAEEVIASGEFSLINAPKENFAQAGTNFTSEQIFQLVSIATDQSGNPAWGYTRFGSPIFMPNSDNIKLFHDNDIRLDRKSTRLNSSHSQQSRMPSSA